MEARAVRIPSYPDRVRDLMGAHEPEGWVSQIYRSYGAELKRFLMRRLGDAAAAEDVAQEAYLQLHRVEQARVRAPRALLFVTASHLAVRYVRQRGAPEAAFNTDEVEALPDPGLTPETAAELDDAIRVLEEVVASMPDRLRIVWVLRQIEGLLPSQIAERLGLSLKAVTRRLERARALCQQGMLKRGIDRLGPG